MKLKGDIIVNDITCDSINGRNPTTDGAKLEGIEANATADQTGAQIKSAYEGELDTNAFTDSEKTKLAGLESSKYLGEYASLSALQSAHSSPSTGSYANVDSGASSDVKRYAWDSSDSAYVEIGTGTALSDSQVKTQYEANGNTNAYTDAEKAKVGHLSVTQAVDLDQMELDVIANNAKTGITSTQSTEISNNTLKTGITSAQASAITANTSKTGITSSQASAITANTSKTGITSAQSSAITANTSKTGITSAQASAITANTAKTGITSAQTTKLSNIETSATEDQTDSEIETAYNNQVGAASLSEVQAGTSSTIKRFTPQRVKQAIEYCLPELTKSIFIVDPIATDDFGIWQPGVAITVTKVVVQGIGATSTTFNINSNGTDLWTSDKVATTTKQSITSFNNAGFAADQYVQYQASAISGTPTGIKITITYTEG